jgi:hypothetical protein
MAFLFEMGLHKCYKFIGICIKVVGQREIEREGG